MARITQRLRRFLTARLLFREIRGMRKDLSRLSQQVERIATALELRNAHEWPQEVAGAEGQPGVEVSYADTQLQQEMVDIESRLTAARGLPPTEDEVVQEFLRRHPDHAFQDLEPS